ncbi:ATPase associated with various cellular activities family protein [Spironucleus salmonicida]|uniref:ATPase associated with various cellular activities family protein n=1 Tax=Spironucleus salmonicida TaxID=348837 RepID=V6LL54_9EUKA|nr:ATPase associated with various cellular activities family protein [Spironucleus salmonicida]|eukprot:EST44471.1 ATPase associated with various cellular activities family protein [Spironucleus salmonicida]
MEIHIINKTEFDSTQITELSEYILNNSLFPPQQFEYSDAQIRILPCDNVKVFQYWLSTEQPEPLEINNTIMYVSQPLPHQQLEILNDTLKFPESVIKKLSNYVKFIMANKYPSLHLHKLLLLAGPPGGGKTSLALKIFQNCSYQIKNSILITVNAHALFSKYFSESGKIVQRLFNQIIEESESNPVFLLIDEIESLASTRNNDNEPTDSIRAANAVLTQLDQLRNYPNIITICTSNLTDKLDPAFIDRCDIIQQIELPNITERIEILKSVWSGISSEEVNKELVKQASAKLEGYSGRALRKIGIQALVQLEEDFNQEDFWLQLINL